LRDLHARVEEWLLSEGFKGDESGLAKQFGNYGHSLGLVVEAPLVIADEKARTWSSLSRARRATQPTSSRSSS
jgi:hypothetical protein